MKNNLKAFRVSIVFQFFSHFWMPEKAGIGFPLVFEGVTVLRNLCRSANIKTKNESLKRDLKCVFFLVIHCFPLFSGPRIFETSNTNISAASIYMKVHKDFKKFGKSEQKPQMKHDYLLLSYSIFTYKFFLFVLYFDFPPHHLSSLEFPLSVLQMNF